MKNQHSKDYSEIARCYRPGHADYCFDAKYGFRDYQAAVDVPLPVKPLVVSAAGAIAAKLLKEMGISILTYTKSIGPSNH